VRAPPACPFKPAPKTDSKVSQPLLKFFIFIDFCVIHGSHSFII
jgi:hypothetical protein